MRSAVGGRRVVTGRIARQRRGLCVSSREYGGVWEDGGVVVVVKEENASGSSTRPVAEREREPECEEAADRKSVV